MDDQPQQVEPTQPAPPPVPPEPEPAPAPQAGPPSSRRKSVIKVLLLTLLIIILVGGAAYGTYAWQHKKVNSLNTKVTSLQSQVNSINQQLQKAKETAQSSNPTVNWKSYTLKNEKISFKYPSTWKLTDNSNEGLNNTSDNILLTTSNNFEVNIVVNKPAATPAVVTGYNLVDADPITYVGQQGFIDMYNNQSTTNSMVQSIELSMDSTNPSKHFPAKNISGATVRVFISYHKPNETANEAVTLASILKDSNYKDAKLLIESMSY